MSLNFEEINILGNITNDSYGRGSTNQHEYGNPRLGGYDMGGVGASSSVATKCSMQGDHLYVTSLSVINLGPIGAQHHEISKAENELNQHIKSYISYIKKEFKKKENAGRALKSKLVKDSEVTDVEMINHYANNRRAYVKRTMCFEIG
jgi:hypothetical protein